MSITMVFLRFSSILMLMLLMTSAPKAMADVGTRHLLLSERATMKAQLDALSGDTTAQAREQSHALTTALVAMDTRIFASYDETVGRLYQQQRRRTSKDRMLAFVALFCCFIALASVAALYFANKRALRENRPDLVTQYRQFYSDLTASIGPTGLPIPALAKMSPVVMIGVLGMALSILAYLISSLH